MKKLFLLLMLCVILFSCQKQEDVKMVTISFKTNILSGNPMTKSSSNECLDIIHELTQYGSITLKGINGNGIEYTATLDETIVVPEGNYDIYYNDNSINVAGIFYSTPPFECHSKRIYIYEKNKIINIDLYYNCYAIFVPTSECDKVIYLYENSYGKYEFPKVGDYFVGFFMDGFNGITLFPKDRPNDYETIMLSTDGEDESIKVDKGKYYILHPDDIDVESSFIVNIQDMVEGII